MISGLGGRVAGGSIFSGRTKQGQIENPFDFPDFSDGPKAQQQYIKDENAKANSGFVFLEKIPEPLEGRGGCLVIGWGVLHGQLNGKNINS